MFLERYSFTGNLPTRQSLLDLTASFLTNTDRSIRPCQVLNSGGLPAGRQELKAK